MKHSPSVDTAAQHTHLPPDVVRVFGRLVPLPFGVAVGTVTGLVVMLATLILVLRGGPVVGPRLALLDNFFIGYTVTPVGSLVGFFWGFVAGFVPAILFAWLRNGVTHLYLHLIRRRAEGEDLGDLLDRMS